MKIGAPRQDVALVAASSRSVMATVPPIAGPATRPVDLSTNKGVRGRPLMVPDVRGHDLLGPVVQRAEMGLQAHP